MLFRSYSPSIPLDPFERLLEPRFPTLGWPIFDWRTIDEVVPALVDLYAVRFEVVVELERSLGLSQR